MKKIITIAFAFCAVLSTKAQINSGSPAKRFNSNTGYGANGVLPTNLPSGGTHGKSQDAATAYESWKTRFVRSCSPNGSRVLFDDNTSTVSEGIAYGMLLSAYAGDKALFDDLWKFYKANSNGNGLMNWKLSGCTGVSGAGGATDAELDAALALMVAEDQWSTATSPYDYRAEVVALLPKIRAFEVTNNIFNNGDQWGNSSCRNPSYQSPAYTREFAKLEAASTWNSITAGNNALLRANRNATTGLVSNWSDPSGNPNNCNGPNEHGFDAIRNPWRMATDILWHGRATGTDNSNTSVATDISDKLAAWAKNHADNLKGPLPMNAANPGVGSFKNGTFSPLALPFMVAGSTYQSALNTAYTNIVNLGNGETYFNSTLRAITLFMMTGNFWQPGSNLLTANVTILTPASNTTVKEGVAVNLTANATISAGTISKVEYFDGTTLLGAGTGASYTYSISTLSSGVHTIVAKAYDAANTVVATSSVNILISGASDVSTTGVVDMMEKATVLAEVTGGKTGASCATATAAATAGLFWFEDRDPATPYVATYTRTGNGLLTYTITKAAGDYNVIGFNFGEYCKGTAKNNYYLDLTSNSVLKFTITSPATNTASFEFKIQMKDSAGNVLAFDKTFLTGGTGGTKDVAGWYKYDIGFSKNHPTTGYQSLLKGTTKDFEYNFANALSIINPSAASAANINASSAPFDFKKVKEVVFTPLNSLDSGAPDYIPAAFANQTLVFSNVVLGDVSLGNDFCTTPAAPTPGAGSTLCENSSATALTATGLAGLNLQWYTTPTDGTASSVAPIPSTATVGTSNYYVSQKVGLTGTCEGPRATIAVNVTAAPTANAGTDQIAAAGPSISLTGTGSAVGTWSVANAPVGAIVSFSPSASGASVTANGLKEIGNYTFTYTVAGTAPCAATASSVKVNITTVLGVEDAFLRNNVSIYPNPSTDILYVNLSKVDGTKTVKLVDTYGKVVYESSSSESSVIPMSHLSEGMYFVQIQAASGTMTKSIIKK